MKSVILRSVVFAMILACATSALAVEKKKPAATAPKKAPVAATAPVTQTIQANSVTQAFMDKGVKTCAARINQVTNFLSGNAPNGAILYLPASQPDQSLVSTSMEIITSETNSAYASLSFAPNQANGCGAVYEAVTWFPGTCDKVLETQYPGRKIAAVLKKNVSGIIIDANTRVFLVPTSGGCISIKKELVSQ